MARLVIVVMIRSDRSFQDFVLKFSAEPYGFSQFHVYKCENASRV